MKNSVKMTAITIAAICATNTVLASDAIGPGDRDARWLVGGAVGSATNIYAGEGNSSTGFPNISFNGKRFFIKDGSVNYSIREWGALSAGLTARYDANFLSFDEEYRNNSKLAGLEERDATIDGGFYVNHTTDLGRLQFSFLTDLGDKHDGHSASLQYTFNLKAGDWHINPVIGSTWISADKANHYFGVSNAEATVTRSSYNGDSTVNLFAGVRARYAISDKWDLNLQTGVKRFGSGITDSSIVDEKSAYYGSFSLDYNF